MELKNDRRIKVTTQDSVEGGNIRRHWECTFPVHCRDGPGSNHNGNVNQTVYISGFKIAVREDVLRWWTWEPVVEPVPAIPERRHACRLAKFLRRVFSKKDAPRYPHGEDGDRTIDRVPGLPPVGRHLTPCYILRLSIRLAFSSF